MRRTLLLLTIFFALVAEARAHTPSRSFSSWVVEGARVEGVVETDARRATQLLADRADAAALEELGAALAAHAAETVTVSLGGALCTGAAPEALAAEPGRVRARLRFACSRPIAEAEGALTLALFAKVSPTHVHYVRLQMEDGPREAALSGPNRTVAMAPGSAPHGWFGFLVSGAEHVLFGLDHLAFLLALALFTGGPRAVAWAATGFTVGHSVTLALVAFEAIRPKEAPVETLIGFTIAFAAAEALRRSEAPAPMAAVWGAGVVLAVPALAVLGGFATPAWPVYAGAALFAAGAALTPLTGMRALAPLLAAAFGLAHGAGFAGGLAVLDLPMDRLAPALLAFNIGVELGQVVALGVFWAGAATLARLGAPTRAMTEALAAALLALGVFWFAERTFLA